MGTTINRLSAVDSIEGGDQFPVYDNGNGDARKASASLLKEYVNQDLPSTYAVLLQSVYFAPSASGFNVFVTAGNSHLILTPSAGFAEGTIALPVSTTLSDKQVFLCNCTQQVNSLTINGNGASVEGAPSALGADSFFLLKYDAIGNTWYRVG